jgi:Tfp pilus assembly protein PilE
MRHIQRINSLLKNQQGLTIVELTIVLVLMGLLMPILFVFLVNTYKDTFIFDDRVKTSTEMKQALWYMEDNIRISNTFLTNVPPPYADVYGAGDTVSANATQLWSYKGVPASTTKRVLISQSFATNGNTLDTGRKPVFVNTPEFDCADQIWYQPQLSYISVYFLKGTTLYKRVITDRTTSLCPNSVQQQKQSCPPSIAQGSRHASCQANDEVLVNNVTGFSVKYFQISQDGSSTLIDPSYNTTDLSAADYAMVTITTSTRNGTMINTMEQRMTKVNQL